jgi:hypothetical protein
MMSDLFILYIAFSYLFVFGLMFATWKDVGSNAVLGAVVCLISAPISMPMLLGVTLIK